MTRSVNLLLLAALMLLFVTGCQTAGTAPQADAAESDSTTQSLRVTDVAQLRYAISQRGTIGEHETYLFNRQHAQYAELVIDAKYATIPVANFIAESINGVMALTDDQRTVAQIVDRSIIRLWLPKELYKQPNAGFGFLSQVLTTSLDRELLETNRHVDRPLPWPTPDEQKHTRK